MTPMVFGALFSAWVLGCLIVAHLWTRAVRSDLPLVLPLGLIVGLGVSSALFFLASLVFARPALVGGALEFTLAATAMWRRTLRRPEAPPPPIPWNHRMTWAQWALATVFVQAVVVAAVVAWRAYLTEPYGGWDGWAIWNMHARFMLRAGPAWPDLLAAPPLNWTHPDYPRLVPASVARLWSWAGIETPAAAGLVSIAFAAALVALLVAIVARQRGRTPALLGGLLLLGTPFFVTFSSNEHADIPLAAGMLAAAVLVILAGENTANRGLWLLAGLVTALTAWTKNEGLLFTVVLAALVCGREWRTGGSRHAGFFLVGLAFGLLPVGVFKLLLAPVNDLMATPLGPRLAQLSDSARHKLILASLWRDLGRFGEWRVLPYLAMALPYFSWQIRRPLVGPERTIPALIALMLAGFYGVYLLSPQDLTWHLDSSLVRLLLQLWPLALLGWSLTVPSGDPVEAGGPHWRWKLPVLVVANILTAAVLVVALTGQLAANEFAAKRSGTARLAVTLGEGWFGIERLGDARWAWSSGDATLFVQATGEGRGFPAKLQFELRSLAPRQITIRAGGTVLWSGAVPVGATPVELSIRKFSDGAMRLEFSTDAPGVREGPGDDARALAFALYEVRLR